jgi:hypothetical protein
MASMSHVKHKAMMNLANGISMKISSETRMIAFKVEDRCTDYFKAKNSIMTKCRDENTCLARSFTWHILHEFYKISVHTIALLYHRSIRNVQYTLSKMRFLTTNTKDFDIYKDFFRVCSEVLKTNGKMILHLGKTEKVDMAEELSKRAQE